MTDEEFQKFHVKRVQSVLRSFYHEIPEGNDHHFHLIYGYGVHVWEITQESCFHRIGKRKKPLTNLPVCKFFLGHKCSQCNERQLDRSGMTFEG